MTTDTPSSSAAELRGHVLIVDDDSHVRRLSVRQLEQAGHRCDEAEGGHRAMSLLDRREVDVVTLDLRMPGRSGLDLLPEIKRRRPDTEVLMLTGNGDADTAISSLTRGAYGYLIKPIDGAELSLQVQRALRHRQLIVERRQYLSDLEDRVQRQTEEIRQAHEETVCRLVEASLYRDQETGAHIKRVGRYGMLLAQALGWSREQIEAIRLAAPMHDVGKIGIPDAILQKPGELTAHEYKIMQTHTCIGAKMLGGSTSPMLQMAADIALSHHERWDGHGYPRGLPEERIPITGRVVAVADVFDALIHDRTYRPAFGVPEALHMMRLERGRHFDPEIFDVFMDLVPELLQVSEDHPDEQRIDRGMLLPVVSPRAQHTTAAATA